eukprot:CAMPEP_0179156342 /NCGR_PEP_ID=MMETSP0796-20121207/76211_1 /TAXON_ID=73915 /ORGANISM="Pyrodinium bahamense, Strain pbaha01" /LENGTH=186 /DNA_ID=CAMNT_0020857911 /DNA_START=15 /DNA_END=573 /DNA_ORIENTATION=+
MDRATRAGVGSINGMPAAGAGMQGVTPACSSRSPGRDGSRSPEHPTIPRLSLPGSDELKFSPRAHAALAARAAVPEGELSPGAPAYAPRRHAVLTPLWHTARDAVRGERAAAPAGRDVGARHAPLQHGGRDLVAAAQPAAQWQLAGPRGAAAGAAQPAPSPVGEPPLSSGRGEPPLSSGRGEPPLS